MLHSLEEELTLYYASIEMHCVIVLCLVSLLRGRTHQRCFLQILHQVLELGEQSLLACDLLTK